jgi:hypothetical protein
MIWNAGQINATKVFFLSSLLAFQFKAPAIEIPLRSSNDEYSVICIRLVISLFTRATQR